MLWQTIIHLTFVISAVALAAIDRFLSPKSTADRILEAKVQGHDGAEPAPAQATG